MFIMNKYFALTLLYKKRLQECSCNLLKKLVFLIYKVSNILQRHNNEFTSSIRLMFVFRAFHAIGTFVYE